MLSCQPRKAALALRPKFLPFVMPRSWTWLDPGIHPSKKLDCRVKPGDDEKNI